MDSTQEDNINVGDSDSEFGAPLERQHSRVPTRREDLEHINTQAQQPTGEGHTTMLGSRWSPDSDSDNDGSPTELENSDEASDTAQSDTVPSTAPASTPEYLPPFPSLLSENIPWDDDEYVYDEDMHQRFEQMKLEAEHEKTQATEPQADQSQDEHQPEQNHSENQTSDQPDQRSTSEQKKDPNHWVLGNDDGLVGSPWALKRKRDYKFGRRSSVESKSTAHPKDPTVKNIPSRRSRLSRSTSLEELPSLPESPTGDLIYRQEDAPARDGIVGHAVDESQAQFQSSEGSEPQQSNQEKLREQQESGKTEDEDNDAMHVDSDLPSEAEIQVALNNAAEFTDLLSDSGSDPNTDIGLPAVSALTSSEAPNAPEALTAPEDDWLGGMEAVSQGTIQATSKESENPNPEQSDDELCDSELPMSRQGYSDSNAEARNEEEWETDEPGRELPLGPGQLDSTSEPEIATSPVSDGADVELFTGVSREDWAADLEKYESRLAPENMGTTDEQKTEYWKHYWEANKAMIQYATEKSQHSDENITVRPEFRIRLLSAKLYQYRQGRDTWRNEAVGWQTAHEELATKWQRYHEEEIARVERGARENHGLALEIQEQLAHTHRQWKEAEQKAKMMEDDVSQVMQEEVYDLKLQLGNAEASIAEWQARYNVAKIELGDVVAARLEAQNDAAKATKDAEEARRYAERGGATKGTETREYAEPHLLDLLELNANIMSSAATDTDSSNLTRPRYAQWPDDQTSQDLLAFEIMKYVNEQNVRSGRDVQLAALLNEMQRHDFTFARLVDYLTRESLLFRPDHLSAVILETGLAVSSELVAAHQGLNGLLAERAASEIDDLLVRAHSDVLGELQMAEQARDTARNLLERTKQTLEATKESLQRTETSLRDCNQHRAALQEEQTIGHGQDGQASNTVTDELVSTNKLLEEANSRLAECQEHGVSLWEDLTKAADGRKVVEAHSDYLESELAILKVQHMECQEHAASASAICSDKEQMIARLKAELEQLSERARSLEEELNELIRTVGKREAETADLETTISILEQASEARDTRTRELEIEVARGKATVADNETTITMINEHLSLARLHSADVTQRLEECQQRGKGLHQEQIQRQVSQFPERLTDAQDHRTPHDTPTLLPEGFVPHSTAPQDGLDTAPPAPRSGTAHSTQPAEAAEEIPRPLPSSRPSASTTPTDISRTRPARWMQRSREIRISPRYTERIAELAQERKVAEAEKARQRRLRDVHLKRVLGDVMLDYVPLEGRWRLGSIAAA